MKKFKKALDKTEAMWYNIKVASQKSKDKRKENKKYFQKSLDKLEWMWYDIKAVTTQRRNRTLKIEQ